MNIKSIIETVLFVNGEAITAKKIAKIIGAKEAEVSHALEELKTDYTERGIVILEKDGEYMLGSNPGNAAHVEALIKNEFTEELSKAAVETLAVIAYKGPLTRAQIEYMRGVNSSFTLRNLLMRGIIERIDNPVDSRSYLYRISFDFLKHFGLTKIEDLPHYDEFKKEEVSVPEEKPRESKEPETAREAEETETEEEEEEEEETQEAADNGASDEGTNS